MLTHVRSRKRRCLGSVRWCSCPVACEERLTHFTVLSGRTVAMLLHQISAVEIMRFALSSVTATVGMRPILLIVSLWVAGSACSAATVGQTIDECWVNHDHSAMADCVTERQAAARAHLLAVEGKMRAAIEASPESPRYITKARSEFGRSLRAYASYRSAQCSLRAALAATGNGSHEVGKACEAELDSTRADQLEASM